MKLTPKLIRQLHTAAEEYEDDNFFGVRSKDHEFFVCNWVFGLRFAAGEIMNCPHVRALEDETDRICSTSDTKRDIVRHMFSRSWMDILVGTGIYQDAQLVQLHDDEHHIFEQRGWRIIPFETDAGRRFYIKESYFDVAEEAIGDEIQPVIFRPVVSSAYPGEYRPMLFQDGDGEVRGLVYAISEENMRNPVDRTAKWRREVETSMPEFYEG
jgi:hypothetical protein